MNAPIKRSVFAQGTVFDSVWRANCSVKSCGINEVDAFLKRHYLGKRPAIVQLCLVMLHGDAPVGCIVYSAPVKAIEARYGGATWELARVYLLDEIPRNAETWLIGQSVRHIKKHYPFVQYLVSYADSAVGHQGTIYRAANWVFDGITDEERKSPRFDYFDAISGKKYRNKGKFPEGAEVIRVPRSPKNRFYLPLQKAKPCA